NVIISGPFGRMGQALTRLAVEHNSINLAGGLIAANSTSDRPADYPVHTQLIDFPTGDKTAVLIDFTEASATIARLHEAAEHNIPVVIGTTGFSPTQLKEIRTISHRIPVLLSANMSLGINLLLDVVENLAARLSGYDIEVIETHHRLKKDAPSGTAIALA